MMTTSAGTVRPCKFVIMGSGLPDFRPLQQLRDWGQLFMPRM